MYAKEKTLPERQAEIKEVQRRIQYQADRGRQTPVGMLRRLHHMQDEFEQKTRSSAVEIIEAYSVMEKGVERLARDIQRLTSTPQLRELIDELESLYEPLEEG